MFTVKIVSHLMPWEIDYAMMSFIKLQKSYYRIPLDIKIQFECVLNVSDYIIDWNNSKIPKQFFIEKFNEIRPLIECFDVTRYEVIDLSDRLYGHLDLQKESVSEDVNGYIYFCPDRNFDDTTLPHMCLAAREIKEKYFVMVTEIYKGWDETWDILSNKKYDDIQHNEWSAASPFKIEIENEFNDLTLESIPIVKFAGWFDYYSKDFVNKLVSVPVDWSGYGPWDLYAMRLASAISFQNQSLDISQFVLRGKVIHSMETVNMPGGFSSYYKNLIFNGVTDKNDQLKIEQRRKINASISENIERVLEECRVGKILL